VLSFNICVDEFFIGISGGIIRHIEYEMSGQTDHRVLISLLEMGWKVRGENSTSSAII
jgi:hypothetical protein